MNGSTDYQTRQSLTSSDGAVRTFDEAKDEKYIEANAEYVRRGLVLTGAKVRGSSAEQALTAIALKETQRGNPNAATLASLHDKLEALKDLIEAAVDQAALDAINVTDDAHWS